MTDILRYIAMRVNAMFNTLGYNSSVPLLSQSRQISMPNNTPIVNRLPLIMLLLLLVGIVVYIQWPNTEQKKQKSQQFFLDLHMPHQ